MRRSRVVKRRRAFAGASGFSLVEVLVVIGVLALAALVGLPSLMGQIRKVRLESAAADIANVMRQTRLRAIRDNEQYTVKVDGSAVTGQGLIGEIELEIDDSNISLYTDGGSCPAAPEIVYDGSGVADVTSAFCVDDGLGNILQVALQSTSGQPKVLKFLQAADAPDGVTAGFYEKTSTATAGKTWAWY